MQEQGMQDEHASLPRRLRTWYELCRAYAAGRFSGDLFSSELDFVREHATRRLGVKDLHQLRILDVGCGQKAPMTCLFDAAGANVTGIDVERPTGPLSTFALLRSSYPYGLERVMKSLGRRLLGYDRAFYRNIAQFVDSPIRPQSVDLRIMDVAELQFPDGEFDIVYSAVAFEHVADVAGAVRELWRVCKKPKSLILVRIHLFASLGGGHNQPRELATNGGHLAPWAHLRDKRYLPSIYLNRLRLDDYLKHFGAFFELREVTKKEEPGARKLLTPELEAELSMYSKEDLLTQLLTVIGTPRLPKASMAPRSVSPVDAKTQ